MEKMATVFYVDDNPKSRRLLTSILEERGFEVISADNPVEALDRADELDFDLALLDYQMPGMMGTELARQLKIRCTDVPVVVISGLASLPAGDLGFVNAHLGHGATLERLLDTIEL